MLCSKPNQDAVNRLMAELDSYCVKSNLSKPLADGKVECLACAQNCHIAPGKRGVCAMRFNRPETEGGAGALWVPHGYVAGLAVDPIEKKPLFHVFPGRKAVSFGMLGCNLHCDYCQNWVSSQALRDPQSSGHAEPISAAEIVKVAIQRRAPVITSTYNEPLITAEWSFEVMTEAQRQGVRGGFVSNGYASAEVLEYLRPVLNIYKVDLKAFQDASYRQLGGRLQPVLDTIQRAHRLGYWVEIVTLVIPGFNDSDGELRDMAQFIRSVSPDIPWHVTAFHPDYKEATGAHPTSPADIERAAWAGADAGLNFVYAGNLRGGLGELENTGCPSCRATLIRRRGYTITEMRIGADGKCPDCHELIPGIWG
ncbi:MAG: AmmeMemoRadiSam system radical SAM enzyme [Candidatus Sumerlaeota bacterium]|nr:AmmeMemoRadiSam system radical SAM enzyme [Candidatus Sumerlaeota bacterium]